MVKFLHTADWHIGKKNKKLGEVADKVRKQRLRTAELIVEKAHEENVDFIIISGDLFEDNNIDRDIVDKVIDILSDGIDTYILPGNHDPLKEGSVYYHDGWDSAENIHIFEDEEKVIFNEEIIFYPCPLTQKKSNSDPTRCIPNSDEGDCIKIGIAHGTLDIGLDDSPNFPITKDRVIESNLDYLALGEWHSWNTFETDEKIKNTVYPSAPEPTKFDEADAGNVALVEINKKGVKLEKEKVSSLSWLKWEKEITDIESVKDVENKISELENSEKTILNLDVRGVVSPDVYNSVEDLEDYRDIMFLEIKKKNLFIKPDLEEIIGVIPSEFREVVDDLIGIMSKDPEMVDLIDKDSHYLKEKINEIKDRDLKIDEEPELAQKALSILYRYSREVEQ